MTQRYRFIKFVYTGKKAGIGACNLCIPFGLRRFILRHVRNRSDSKFQPLVVEIKEFLIMCIMIL